MNLWNGHAIQKNACANPCKAPIKKFRCRCKASEVENYFHKLSGPILDRIDLTFIMTENEVRKPQLNLLENLKKEISDAQKFSMRYFGNLASDLEPEWLDENLPKSLAIEKILSDVTSLRARHKILRVARSIQALDQQSELKEAHVFEAKWYRLLTEETI
jgi:magnesium chelatase family protein